ncbi:MAG: phosphatase PAP2 family protein [Steroidobacteraceae bacterium]
MAPDAAHSGRQLYYRLFGLLGVLALCGCATLPNDREWGRDVTLTPGWQKVRNAAAEAVESPRFWGPLAAAALFQVDRADRKVSTWGRRHTPIFGSQQNAAAWSDHLRAASLYVYVASVLVTPSGSDPKEWMINKLRGSAVGLAAIGVTDEESVLLKRLAARERPNGQDKESMPSSHTSRSAVLIELAHRNFQSLELAPVTRRALDFGLDALTYGTAWARVEAGFHFPSDTLVGMSLGNFNGAFFNDAFSGTERRSGASLTITPLVHGAALDVRFSF